jgi:hypothetical protein
MGDGAIPREGRDRTAGVEAAGPRGAPDRGSGVEGETVDRDALGQADYGSRRDDGQPARQGGASTDDAAGSSAAGTGRQPTEERDRDYDPDGERTDP